MTASLILMTNNFPSHIAALKKVRYAPCPMPYARRVPHLFEKGYMFLVSTVLFKCPNS